MRTPPPLRFLALVVGLWICLRAAILAPDWRAEPTARAPLPPPARIGRPLMAARRIPAPAVDAARSAIPVGEAPPIVRASALAAASPLLPAPDGPANVSAVWPAAPGPLAPPIPALPMRQRRWSVSAWLLVRGEGGGPTLAPGGTLGGSQAGARMRYRLGGGLALSARVYAPLRRMQGAEAAVGVEWKLSPRLPVHLLAERRQAAGREGRSAFALTLHGGASAALPRSVRIDAYGQAGIVGLRARDPFADGSVRVTAPAGPVEIGGGAWGAAQPGLARLDAGPSISWRLPVRGAGLRLQADWRFRLAGDAAPGSGPAFTLAADF